MTIQIHSYWAYVTLILIIVAVLNSLIGWFSNKEFASKDRKIALFALIASHIQLLIGIVSFFTSSYFEVMKVSGMGEVMKNSVIRKAIIEHPTMMIIAIVLITMGFSKHKKKENSTAKFKTISIFYTIALIVTLAMIPWSIWLH